MAETQNSKQNVQAPQAGQTVIVNAIPGQDIVLEAAFDQAEVKLDNGNVVFEFANGGQVVLNFSDLGTAQAPNVVMPDGTILNMEEFLASLGQSEIEPAAGPEGGADGSGGVGEYRDDAGNLIDGVAKLGVLDPRAFTSISVEALEADFDNPLPTAGIVDGAADEDGLRISEMTPFDGNDDERTGDHPAKFAYVEGFLSYDFGGDGPAGTNPFVWSLNGLAAKGVTSQGNTLLYEVVDGVTLNAYYMGMPDYPENGEGPVAKIADFQETPLVKILVFTIQVTDVNTGAYRFELYRPLDHSDPISEDDIVYNFTFTITDGSGDTAVGGVNMIVDDDSPIWRAGEANVSALVVEEAMRYDDDDLSDGNGDGGSTVAQMPSSSTGDQSTIEAFLGIASGGLSPLAESGAGHDNATNGSAMKTTIMVEAGDEVSFSWFFNADDYSPYNDFSFVSFNGVPVELADISMVGSYGQTPWATYTHVATSSGPLTIGFGVMNTGDSGVNSYLTIDNIKLNGVTVPNGGFENGNFSNWQVLGDPTLISNALYTDEASGMSGSLGALVSFGADGPGEFSMLTDTSALPSLFSKGEAVQYIVEGNTLIAYVGGYPSDPGEIEVYTVSLVDDGGYRVVFTLEINPDGSWFFDLKDQLDHVDDGENSKNFELFTGEGEEGVTSVSAIDFSSLLMITDGDGDVLIDAPAGSFAIQIQDDVPKLVGQKIVFTVDEDDIKTPWSQGTSPNDGNADGSYTGGPGDPWWNQPAYVAGSVAAAVSFGADEHGTFGFTADIIEKMDALQLYSKQTALPENGLLLTYKLSYSGDFSILTAYEPDAPGPGNTGNPVFQLKLNQTNGDFEFRLYDELIHVAPESGADENFLLRSGPEGFIEAINFGAVIQAVDFDGDAVTLDGMFEIQVRDDVPVIGKVYWTGATVTHDETAGVQPNTDTGAYFVAPRFASVENPGDDPHVPGSGPIGYARSGPAIIDVSGVKVGADSPALASGFSLVVLDANSGLKTTEGNAITLSVDGAGRIIGTVVNGEHAGKVAFAIAIDGGDGEVFVAQYLSLWHPNTKNHDEAVDLGGNKIAVRYSVTDSDGDTVYKQMAMGSVVKFEDDGPGISVKASGESNYLLTTFDEKTRGENSDTASTDFSGVFSSTWNAGSDGLGNLTAMSYALGLFYGVKDSGLDSNGANVNLYKIGSAIFGSTADTSGAVDVATNTNVVFKLEVDGAGVVKLTQFQEIDHKAPGVGSDYSDQLAVLGNNLVKLTATQTITDGDGDTATDSAAIDLGGNIRFADDGPSVSAETIVVLDDEGLDKGIPGGLGDVPGEAIVVNGFLDHDFGADGPGSISFASMDGTFGTVGVETVEYTWDGSTNTLLATGPRGPLFQVEVKNVATGEYEVTLLDNVLHDAGGTLAVNWGNHLSIASIVTVGVMVPGDPAASLINNGGAFGIQSSVDGGDGGRFNEINHSLVGNPTASEVMVFQLQGERVASSAVVDISLFFGNEAGVGNEVGSYELWLDGAKVQNAVAFQANSGTGNYQLVIAGPEGGFDEIRFAALPGTNPGGTDDSDYSIKQVTFDLSYENNAIVDLTYTVTDGDFDTAQGTLRLVINDDMPKSVENLAGAPQPVESFKAGGLGAGWDPNALDPKVIASTNTDADPYLETISWGTVNGAQSGYEFVDNPDLKGSEPFEHVGQGALLIGTFTHHNFPITSGTSIETAHLKVSFDVTVGTETVTIDHTIKFNHNETPNNSADPDDIVTIIDGTNIVQVEFNGLKYALELGFKSGGNIVTEIKTAENASTSVQLVAELKLVPDYLGLEGTVELHYGADGPADSGALTWIGVDNNGEIDGLYGTLKVGNDGSYEYKLSDGAVPQGAVETFNYTLTDADGDSATSTLTIMLDYKGEIG